jgi:hypothetical protein
MEKISTITAAAARITIKDLNILAIRYSISITSQIPRMATREKSSTSADNVYEIILFTFMVPKFSLRL